MKKYLGVIVLAFLLVNFSNFTIETSAIENTVKKDVIRTPMKIPVNNQSTQPATPVVVVDARVVVVPNNNSYTHRWEVDVHNTSDSLLSVQTIIGVETHQYNGTQIAGISGGASIRGMAASETKTISGGFKAAAGANRVHIQVRVNSVLLDDRYINF
jgi:hypothetical protein